MAVGVVVLWCAPAVVLVVALMSLTPGWSQAGHILSNFRGELLGVVAVFAGLLAWRRRWVRVGVVGLVGVALGVTLVSPRAAWVGESGEGVRVSVLQFNSFAHHGSDEEAFALIVGEDVDLVSVVEPSYRLLRMLRESEVVGERWPHALISGMPTRDHMTILSRWPIELQPGWRNEDHGVLVVHGPMGAMGFGQLHPSSPRKPATVAKGDATIVKMGALVEALRERGVPIVIAMDLNGTPTSARGRAVRRELGLLPSKRWWSRRGTWPTELPSWMRVAIDDVWVSDDVGVVSRRHAGSGGSDHEAVVVEVVVPRDSD